VRHSRKKLASATVHSMDGVENERGDRAISAMGTDPESPHILCCALGYRILIKIKRQINKGVVGELGGGGGDNSLEGRKNSWEQWVDLVGLNKEAARSEYH